MPAPGTAPEPTPPIGLRLTRTARLVSQAFDRAMEAAGGSRATRQGVLLGPAQQGGAPSAMAEAIAITGGPPPHPLNSLERSALVGRWREEQNRRVQRTELPPAGEELFESLRGVAVA